MMLHTYNPQLISLPSINFLHLSVSEILPGQDFIGQGHYQGHTMILHMYNPQQVFLPPQVKTIL